MKHTPGPWSIRYLSGLDMEIFSEHGRICSFSGFSHSIELMDEHEAEETANANLIAAAPELLEALKSITLSMKAHPDCTEGSEFADMVNIAEKAINKAKGLPQQS